MDKARDVRSVRKQQIIKQSKSGLDRGCGVFSENSKKERLKRLSLVGRVSLGYQEDSEMDSFGSDGEDELGPTAKISKKFNPKRFLNECNSVDHASVPRKLRSAMRKRGKSTSPLPESKKLSFEVSGVQLKKGGCKRFKLNMEKGDIDNLPIKGGVGPITKDEEEVAETLYALAGMIPENDKINENYLDSKQSETKSLSLPQAESSMSPFAVSNEREKPGTKGSASTAGDFSYSIQESASESLKFQSPSEAMQHDLPNSQQLPSAVSPFPRNEPITQKTSCSSVITGISSDELNQWTGSGQPEQEGTQARCSKKDISAAHDVTIGSQGELWHVINEDKNNGSALWPGLCLRGLPAQMQGPFLGTSTAKLPAWLHEASGAMKHCSFGNIGPSAKASKLQNNKNKLWRRCTAHVYISRLIQVLKVAERKDNLRPTQFTFDGVVATNSGGGRNGLSSLVSMNSVGCSSLGKNAKDVRNAVMLQKMLFQDQQQACSSGLHDRLKQSFDFLSLSAGACGLDVNTGCNVAGNGCGASTQFNVPCLQSFTQNHTMMTLSMPQNHYSSGPLAEHHSPATSQLMHIQAPSFLGGATCGSPQLANAALPNQLNSQQKWASLLAAQYKPCGIASSYIPNWSYGGRRESPSLVQCVQSALPPSHSSLEVLGPKYAPVTTTQQQLGIPSSSSSSPARGKHHPQLPAGCEGTGLGFSPTSYRPPLQLLCNQYL